MLLRSLVSRELLLPPMATDHTSINFEMDIDTGEPKETYYEEVYLACLQVPLQKELNPLAEKGDIYNAIQKKMAQDPVVCKNVDRQQHVVPLRLQNHR